jgi:uncharacterized YccA/Bax inhibitor family protein
MFFVHNVSVDWTMIVFLVALISAVILFMNDRQNKSLPVWLAMAQGLLGIVGGVALLICCFMHHSI